MVLAGKSTMNCSVMGRGAPSSPMITSTSAPRRLRMPSAISRSSCARRDGAVSAHGSNARRAAATARSTSSGLPSGTRPITASVEASVTSKWPLPSGATHSPSIKNLSKTITAALILSQTQHRRRSC